MHLLQTDAKDYEEGKEQTVKLSTPELDLEGIKWNHLLNVGLLTLKGGVWNEEKFEEIICKNMVVNVTADKKKGGLKKMVINPIV